MLLVADRIRKISVATILPFAAGCMAVPADGPPPKIRDVTTLKADYALTTSDSSVWPDEDWWKEFADPQLDALVSEALANSPDVVAAAARLRRAAATAREEGGARLPSLDASASGYEERRSLNNGFSNEIKQYLPRGWRSGGDASVSAGFDLDLWGRNRAAHAAATRVRPMPGSPHACSTTRTCAQGWLGGASTCPRTRSSWPVSTTPPPMK